MKHALMIGCALVMAGCSGDSQTAVSDPPPPIPGSGTGSLPGQAECTMSEVDRAMLAAVNAARASARSCGNNHYAAAPALVWSCPLAVAASSHSQDMASHDFMGHTGSNGLNLRDRVRIVGYSWSAIGENVAAGQDSVEKAMQSWLDSPGHCANIMNPTFLDLGAASATSSGSTYKIYWTQVFGRGR